MDTSESATPQFSSSVDFYENQRVADLNWAIGLNRQVLKVLGLWVYPGESKWQTIISNFQTLFFGLTVFIGAILPMLLALFKVWGNMDLVIENLITNLPAATSEIKLINIWYHKKVFARIFEEIEKDWLEPKSQEEREIMINGAAIAKKVTKFGLILAFSSNVSFHGPLLYGVVYRTVNNITDKPGILFSFQSAYPYDISTDYCYYLTVFSQFSSSMLSGITYTNADVLFGVIVLHTTSQLTNLANRIQNTVVTNPQEFQKCLKIHVKNHLRLIQIIEMTEEIFSMMLLALFGSVGFTFCILGYQLIGMAQDDGIEMPMTLVSFYIQYLGYFLFLMFIYSWVGEKLTTQSEAIHTATFNCNWTTLHTKQRTQISLILVRSQYSLQITAGKIIPVTLRTFASLLKTSAGYISFLLAVKE